MTITQSAGSPAGLPPLSPVLLAGFALRPVSPRLLDPLLDWAMAEMHRRYRPAFARLREMGDAEIRIEPSDLPFVFLLRPGSTRPRLRAYRTGEAPDGAIATLRGPFLLLISLLEGQLDGDAVFFSRALTIEGDTGAIMTLRYAIDGAGVDVVRDLTEAAGPLAPALRRVASLMGIVYRRADRDLQTVVSALRAPSVLTARQHADKISAVERRLAEQSRRLERVELRMRKRAPALDAETEPEPEVAL